MWGCAAAAAAVGGAVRTVGMRRLHYAIFQ